MIRPNPASVLINAWVALNVASRVMGAWFAWGLFGVLLARDGRWSSGRAVTQSTIIGTLLAETKLSNRGVGYLIVQAYATFDMPRMYGLLIVLFVLAIGANALLGRACSRA